ncbi:hypothetical protein C8R43DRAFT_963427 [Mycena crocata]|nr:hypothetical protein C8R43DRAFT_963427 [Mycena crocata]
MNDSAFTTFTFAWPVLHDSVENTRGANTALFTTFEAGAERTTSSRTAAQARYRAKNREAEQQKARRRMRVLRDRRASSERLRASPLFEKYRRHVERHLHPIYGNRADPEFMAAWDAFRFRDAPFDRDNARFAVQYSSPVSAAPHKEMVDRQLAELTTCGLKLDLDWDDPAEVAAYEHLSATVGQLDDDSIEFILRHAIPRPTLENLDSCSCP